MKWLHTHFGVAKGIYLVVAGWNLLSLSFCPLCTSHRYNFICLYITIMFIGIDLPFGGLSFEWTVAKFVVPAGNHVEFGNADFMPDKNCLVSVLNVLICSLIKHREKYIHRKLTPKSFCVIDFFFLPSKTCLFCDGGIFHRKVLFMLCFCTSFCSICLLEKKFYLWHLLSDCAGCTSTCNSLSICRCTFLNSLFTGIGKMSVHTTELKEEQRKE